MMNRDSEHDHLLKIYGYFDDVVEYVRCLGLSKDDAYDMAQDVLIKADKKRLQLRDPDKLKAWIMKIAYRDTMRRLKKLSKQWKNEVSYVNDMETGEEFDIYELLPSVKSAEEYACDYETEYLLQDVLKELNDREQTIFVMHNVEGYKLKEIAELLDINESTVRSIHSRTCKKFMAKLEKRIREEDQDDRI